MAAYDLLYQFFTRPLIFHFLSPQQAHDSVLNLLRGCDSHEGIQNLLSLAHDYLFQRQPVEAGGVLLDSPLMLAAGFVKGRGFEDEQAALEAVETGENIIPGWRTIPALVGAVEIGSFTRWPRMGNPGQVLWRDESTRSTQNRVGLKNPGARAAAAFLSRNKPRGKYGINIAVSPGVTDPEQEQDDMLESVSMFIQQQVIPMWFTLNLSCPNTEDDPGGHQTEEKTRRLCGAVVEFLRPYHVPLWVKVSPDLADEQYQKMMAAFADTGVRAVIATNTLGQPAPNASHLSAGTGGGRLHSHAVRA
ncbi:MAG: hypothetical protein K8I82_06935, partial [Anaerolineae bacterium]|nr:hypothetical protein [Anaerolineae bacterium]